ncbi:restriction endonuclease Eco29kI [Clostridiales bacterium PH28_bin88]|nr:restriction endonuclease Eco29kI [Clostridiales bacterium PH28_bin88]
MEKPYNPLDENNLAETLVNELLRRQCGPLPPPNEFEGAGIYALYYTGDFPPYRKIAEANQEGCNLPIYVGKASPPGSRKGLVDLDAPPGTALFSRLREHSESIQAAERNLRLEDFKCRFLVTSVLWLALGEGLLIKRYRPLWNAIVDGFGNHDPGGGRRETSRRPEWDTLHPGRPWARVMKPSKRTIEELESIIRRHLDNAPTPDHL